MVTPLMEMNESHQAQFLKGIELFNREEFYDCHDAIEEVWLQESSEAQPFLQGMIQSAVAFHHYQHGKWGAARSMLKLAIEKLESCPETCRGVPLKKFLQEIRRWKDALDRAISLRNRTPIPLPYPKITLCR